MLVRRPILSAPAAAPALLSLSPGAALAQDAQMPALGASLLQMALGLAVVIGLLLACLWLIRRLGAPRGGAAVKVVGAAAVGPRERVVLVELGERVLVLGVAPGSVTRLDEMKRSELALPDKASAAGRSFASRLARASEQRDAH